VTEGTRQRDRAGGRANTRAAPRLPWALAALSVALFAASVLLWALARSAPVPASWDANLGVGSVLGSVFFLAFPLVGALIASRRPRNPVGWLLLVDGLLWMITGVLDYYIVYGVAQPGSVPYPVGMAGINNWLWVPAVGLPATYLFLLFPDGRLPSRRWRPVAWLSGAVLVLASVGVMLSPGPLDTVGRRPNPFGLGAHPWVETATYTILPLLPLCMLVSALGLVLRYRRSQGEERQQIKWIAFAASVVGLSYHVAMVTSLVFPSGAWYSPGSPLWMDLIVTVALLSFTFVPIAVGLAVLRYRLYDIDLIINCALVYGLLTAMLALVYLGSVVGLQAASRVLTGQEYTLAVVACTLVIAALFNPLRRRVQGFVDRSFYRRKYDATKTLEAFGSRLREEMDLDTLGRNLVGVARRAVQPEDVSLWLRPDPVPEVRSIAIEQFGHDG
jgi:hypothetical protein